MLGVAALIGANAVFVLGEFALVTVDRSRIEQLAEEGDRGAGRVLRAIRRLSFNLSGAQLGITISSIALGFVGEPIIARLVEAPLDALPGINVEPGTGASVLVALTLATVAQMVLGELVPKSWAIARPLGTAKAVVAPFHWFAAVFGPLIAALNGAANRIVRLFGVEPREELEAVRSLDEFKLLFRTSVQYGRLDQDTLPLLSRAISFADKTAADALVPRVSIVTLSADASLADLVRRSDQSGHSRFPVVGETLDEILGIVHVKDLAGISKDQWESQDVESILAEAPLVPESRELASLLDEMTSSGRQMAMVVDEYGGTAGIITIEDIVEEITGEIEDEYDPARLTPLSAFGSHVVSGMLHAEELAEQTGFELPEGDFETLAGFLLAELGTVPTGDETVVWEGWTFDIIAMEARRVDRVRVTPPPGFEQDSEGDGQESTRGDSP